MRAVVVIAALASASRALGDPSAPAPLRRLEAVQLGFAHHEHYDNFETGFGNSPTLSLEGGAFLAPGLGLSLLVRGQRYDDANHFWTVERTEVLLGPRVYFEPIRGRMLAAVGAGLLVTRRKSFDGKDQAVQKFVEVYAGWSVLRSRCTDLEAGVFAGYSPDEEYTWIGLAVAVRRRIR